MEQPIVIYDCEATTWEDALETHWGREGQNPEIVQFAAVKADRAYRRLATFERLVRPTITPQVDPFFAELTGISQDDLDRRGTSFPAAYRDFLDFCGGAYVVCNGWDREAILENLQLYKLENELPLVYSVNIRPWLVEQDVPPEYLTSGRLADYFGLSNDSGLNIHNGVYDSESIRLALEHLYSLGRDVRPFVERRREALRREQCLPLRQLLASLHKHDAP